MSGNIFDRMNDESSEFAPSETNSQETFTVQFGCESIAVILRQGMTVNDVFTANADYLGFEAGRAMTYRDQNNNMLDGTESPVSGSTYTAAIQFDEKG